MMNRPRPLLPKPPRPPAGADFYETHTIAGKKVSIRKVSAKLAKKSKSFTDLVWGHGPRVGFTDLFWGEDPGRAALVYPSPGDAGALLLSSPARALGGAFDGRRRHDPH